MIRSSLIALLGGLMIAAPVAGQTVATPPVATPSPVNSPAVAQPVATTPRGGSMLKAAPADTSLPRQKVVTVFGTDQCPKSTDPDEIVVCVRRPAEERYRIPPAVRNDVKPPTAIEGNRKILLGDAAGGAGGGIGSCSAVGPGGGIGCMQQLQDTYRAAKKAGEVPKSPF